MRYSWLIFLVLTVGCNGQKKYHKVEAENSEVISSTKLAGILKFQDELNKDYKDPKKSPLPDKYRKSFEKLDFFAPDTNYVITAKFIKSMDAPSFLMPTTTDRKPEYKVYGIAYFELNGKEFQLEVYQNQNLILQKQFKNHLFLPFLDKTNGKETYGGGRYIDLERPNGNEIVIDFNRSFNPYCAYSKKYSCPIVPLVNTLDVKVKAGVKAFKK